MEFANRFVTVEDETTGVFRVRCDGEFEERAEYPTRQQAAFAAASYERRLGQDTDDAVTLYLWIIHGWRKLSDPYGFAVVWSGSLDDLILAVYPKREPAESLAREVVAYYEAGYSEDHPLVLRVADVFGRDSSSYINTSVVSLDASGTPTKHDLIPEAE